MNRSTPLILALALLAAPTGVSACSCLQPGPVDKAWQESARVFRGTVIAIKTTRSDTPYRNRLIRFRIEESFKGSDVTELKVLTSGAFGGSCGYPFHRGGEYLVYAYGRSDDALATDICTLNGLAAQRADDLTVLRGLKADAPVQSPVD